MAIIRQNFKKPKPKKPSAQQRALDADWQKLLERHSKPLEQGAQTRGSLPDVPVKRKKKYREPVTEADLRALVKPRVPLPEPMHPHASGGLKSDSADLREAKRNLAARTGALFNKGGVQYLSDDDLAEQKKGTHRRR